MPTTRRIISLLLLSMAGLPLLGAAPLKGPALLIGVDPQNLAEGAPAPAAADLARELKERLAALGLTASVETEGASVVVRFRSAGDLARFKAAPLRPHSFFVRLIDEAATPAAGPPSPGDLRATGQDGEVFWLKPEALITGDMVQTANAGRGGEHGEPVVQFHFNAEGARRFAVLTTVHTGKRVAIVLDGRVMSALRVLDPVTGGGAEITGDFTDETAKTYAGYILQARSGLPMRIIEERPAG